MAPTNMSILVEGSSSLFTGASADTYDLQDIL